MLDMNRKVPPSCVPLNFISLHSFYPFQSQDIGLKRVHIDRRMKKIIEKKSLFLYENQANVNKEIEQNMLTEERELEALKM